MDIKKPQYIWSNLRLNNDITVYITMYLIIMIKRDFITNVELHPIYIFNNGGNSWITAILI